MFAVDFPRRVVKQRVDVSHQRVLLNVFQVGIGKRQELLEQFAAAQRKVLAD